MDVTEQLQVYIDQIVALGRATLARQRRGEWLPDELIGPAEALLALERTFGGPPAGESNDEVAIALAEPTAPADWSSPAEEAPVEVVLGGEAPVGEVPVGEAPGSEALVGEAPVGEAPVEAIVVEITPPEGEPDDELFKPITAMLDEHPEVEPITSVLDEHPGVEHIATMSPVEADDWLSALENDPSGMLILPAHEVDSPAPEEHLVVDVGEEPGDGLSFDGLPSDGLPSDGLPSDGLPSDDPATADALPPLMVDPDTMLGPTNVFGESDSGELAIVEETAAPGTASEVVEASAPAPTPELRFCTNCGAELRPGRRFCHRCGASVAEMLAEVFPSAEPPAAAASVATSAPPPPLVPTTDEWPPFVSDAPRYVPGVPPSPVPAMTRFCNNCGLGMDAGVTVCPDCGSRDIS